MNNRDDSMLVNLVLVELGSENNISALNENFKRGVRGDLGRKLTNLQLSVLLPIINLLPDAIKNNELDQWFSCYIAYLKHLFIKENKINPEILNKLASSIYKDENENYTSEVKEKKIDNYFKDRLDTHRLGELQFKDVFIRNISLIVGEMLMLDYKVKNEEVPNIVKNKDQYPAVLFQQANIYRENEITASTFYDLLQSFYFPKLADLFDLSNNNVSPKVTLSIIENENSEKILKITINIGKVVKEIKLTQETLANHHIDPGYLNNIGGENVESHSDAIHFKNLANHFGADLIKIIIDTHPEFASKIPSYEQRLPPINPKKIKTPLLKEFATILTSKNNADKLHDYYQKTKFLHHFLETESKIKHTAYITNKDVEYILANKNNYIHQKIPEFYRERVALQKLIRQKLNLDLDEINQFLPSENIGNDIILFKLLQDELNAHSNEEYKNHEVKNKKLFIYLKTKMQLLEEIKDSQLPSAVKSMFPTFATWKASKKDILEKKHELTLIKSSEKYKYFKARSDFIKFVHNKENKTQETKRSIEAAKNLLNPLLGTTHEAAKNNYISYPRITRTITATHEFLRGDDNMTPEKYAEEIEKTTKVSKVRSIMFGILAAVIIGVTVLATLHTFGLFLPAVAIVVAKLNLVPPVIHTAIKSKLITASLFGYSGTLGAGVSMAIAHNPGKKIKATAEAIKSAVQNK